MYVAKSHEICDETVTERTHPYVAESQENWEERKDVMISLCLSNETRNKRDSLGNPR